MAQNYGLGRGLASLIPQNKSNNKQTISQPREDFNYFGAKPVGAGVETRHTSSLQVQNGVQEIEVIRIVPNPHQPRLRFDAEKLQELSDSIKEHGVIQPLVVTKNGNQYEIIAGERRFQASKLAGLKTVPVIVRDATEQQKLELAIIENVQRHDLNAIEEAKSYLKLADEFDLSQEEVAKKMGKSRSAVANKLRLLHLPIEIQKALIEGKITEGHAKAILAIENPEKQRALFEMILKNSLTVRQTEDKTKEISVKTHTRQVSIDPETKRIEDILAGALGTKVKLAKAGEGGKIMIDYYSKEELNNILSKVHA
ncbi:MAG: ParB/RepB/Spo0J family partition protein [Candidatus Moranbacteria bacterium]|nr:ParB/RepB/Spo0J family partition protein [Candidatus Moranbacteria bacterium]